MRTYGRHTIRDVSDAPLPTLVRLPGAAGGRSRPTARTPAPWKTQPLPKSLDADRAFVHDILDPAEHDQALLALTEEVAACLCDGRLAGEHRRVLARGPPRRGLLLGDAIPALVTAAAGGIWTAYGDESIRGGHPESAAGLAGWNTRGVATWAPNGLGRAVSSVGHRSANE